MDTSWLPGTFGRRLLFRAFFFAAFLLLLYQMLLLFSPFVSALAGAATVVLLVQPVHVRILRLVRGRENVAAGVSTVLIIIVVVVPVLLMGWLLVNEAVRVLPEAKRWAAEIQRTGEPRIERILPEPLMQAVRSADEALGKWGVDVRELLARGLDAAGGAVADMGRKALGNLLGVAFNAVVIVLAVFFFLRDGARMIRSVVDLLPMETVHKDLVLHRLNETFGAVVRGSILSAATQALLAGIGFAIVGMDFALVLGLTTFLFAFIPFVGAAGVWVPSVLWLFMSGGTWQPWFLLIWGVGVISLVDNLLKPLLIGGRAKIPTFLLFFGILGGLKVYGVLGVFIGPIVLGLLIAFVGIYREQYQARMADDPADGPASGQGGGPAGEPPPDAPPPPPPESAPATAPGA